MKSLKILIIDSSGIFGIQIKKLLHSFLKLSGETMTANNAKEGIIEIQKKFFDLIIINYHNYHMSEIERIKKIKKISPESKIILMTAFASTLEAKRAVNFTGADDFVERIFTEIDLERKIEKLFG